MPRVRTTWNHIRALSQFTRVIESRLKTVGEFMRSAVVRTLSQGRTRQQGPAAAGNPPHTDTGRLRQSIMWQVMRSQLSVRIGTNVIYGRILELGGVIRPKKAKLLSVPVSQEAKRHRGSPRTFKRPLVLVRSRQRLFLVEKRARRTVLHYVLVPKVRIKPHPYLRPTLRRSWRNIRNIINTGRP